MIKEELEKVLLIFKEEELELEDTILTILKLYDKYREELYKEQEKKVEKEEVEEEKEKEEKEKLNYSLEREDRIIKGKIKINERIKRAIENTKHKIPLNLEHIPTEIVGEVINIDVIGDEAIIFAKINKDFLDTLKDKEEYYFSPEVLVLKENEEEYLVLNAVALTTKPSLPTEKTEIVPSEVYSALPKIIRKMLYTHPEVLKYLKTKNNIPMLKPEFKSSKTENIEEKVKKIFWVI